MYLILKNDNILYYLRPLLTIHICIYKNILGYTQFIKRNVIQVKHFGLIQAAAELPQIKNCRYNNIGKIIY